MTFYIHLYVVLFFVKKTEVFADLLSMVKLRQYQQITEFKQKEREKEFEDKCYFGVFEKKIVKKKEKFSHL